MAHRAAADSLPHPPRARAPLPLPPLPLRARLKKLKRKRERDAAGTSRGERKRQKLKLKREKRREREARRRGRGEGEGARERRGGSGSRRARSRRPDPRRRTSKPKKMLWETLEHAGVLFAPDYVVHRVRPLYEGRPVELTEEQEEMATSYAVMLETEYMQKETFLQNFWEAFRQKLGASHTIQQLDKCDFRPIYDHMMAEREKKNAMPKEVKKAIKEEKDAVEAKYKYCKVDGRVEQVGNFRTEPPGLFRGRGEHPKMGMWKRRIMPEDIIINIGKDAPVPEPPAGHRWKEVRHDQTVTWLAAWKDAVNAKEVKYVFLAANSKFKADSDVKKYDRAIRLTAYIDKIRSEYRRNWTAGAVAEQQIAVAIYLMDVLALRAGHEKDEDEADTVGCCNLKAMNVEPLPVGEDGKHQIKLDFLGKDSMRYENTMVVEKEVYECMQLFTKTTKDGKPKGPEELLFDAMNAQDVNVKLQQTMKGLSAKVFRTYNASETLERLLKETESASTAYGQQLVEVKKADYDRANMEVAILCNHQRSVPKAHQKQMEAMEEKHKAVKKEMYEVSKNLTLLKKGNLKVEKGKRMPTEESLKKKKAVLKDRLQKIEVQRRSKEELKTVALGTSKINYMDPRISIAWCKRNEVPIEKIFNKSLLSKFGWAMVIEPDFSFIGRGEKLKKELEEKGTLPEEEE